MDKWYFKKNKDNDIVISTRIRLARNFLEFPFKSMINSEQELLLNKKVTESLKKISLGDNTLEYIDLSKTSSLEKLSLVEKHLISQNFAADGQNNLLILSKDNSISIMVNEEDHLRLQVLSSGLELESAYDTCSKIEQALSQDCDFAFDKKLGYLTSCPTNLGTGLRASVMLHLPAIEKTGAISSLISTVNKFGLTIRGTYGEGSRAIGSVYQLSNQVTLGIDEKTAIDNLQSITMQIIENERLTRNKILSENIAIKDEIFRSLGILKYAQLMSSEEFHEHISNVRMGVGEHLIENVAIPDIDLLMNTCGTASICAVCNKSMPANERDFYRAKLIRQTLNS
ncbi:MAG: protein arginine kinase [Oscillospiraceae bacterium]